jgi:glucan phosphorylase
MPLVGVGLFYTQGCFLQRLDAAGWQREESLAVDVRMKEQPLGSGVILIPGG